MQIRARLNSRSHSEKERERWKWWERGAGGIKDGKRRDKRRTGGETATGEGDNEKGWKTRMDEDEGSGRWNGKIEAWVPRANHGGQVFSPELRPRSATFHQLQNELGYHEHSTEAGWWEGVLFSAGKFPNTLDKGGCCSSNIGVIIIVL